jgi:Domain of Unknown Function (DUF1080)
MAEAQSGGVIGKVVAAVFTAIVAPVVVALIIQYANNQPKPTPPTSAAAQPAPTHHEDAHAAAPARSTPPTPTQTPTPAKPDTPPAPRPAEPTIQLLTPDLDQNFYTFIKGQGKNKDPEKVFTYHDKMLHVSGKVHAALTTDKEYENYRLVVEYRWGENLWASKTREAGILLHGRSDDAAFEGAWLQGIRCRLAENSTTGGTGDLQLYGDPGRIKMTVTADGSPAEAPKRWDYNPAAKPVQFTSLQGGPVSIQRPRDAEKPIREWNTLECLCEGEKIAIRVNGQEVNACTGASQSKGKITIQSLGAEIFFRKIDLEPVKK